MLRFMSRRLPPAGFAFLLGMHCVPAVVRAKAPPLAVQIGLLDKVAKYDRQLETRAGKELALLIYRKGGDATSEKQTDQLQTLIRGLRKVAGIKARVQVLNFVDAEKLDNDVESYAPAVVILTSGLSDQVDEIAEQLTGDNVLTMSTVPADVRAGIVLGFDLIATKPKILINLRQARRQGVDFSTSLLALAKVYR